MATPIKRFLANVLDSGLFVILFMISTSFIRLVVGVPPTVVSVIHIVLQLLLLAYILIQLVFMAGGRSIGKKACGIKVVKKGNKDKVNLGIMIIRETVGKAISGLVFSLGFIWILIDSDNQGWHDKLMSTVVVEDTHQ